MDKKELCNGIQEAVNGFHLPRQNELPELDFYMDQIISIMEKRLELLSSDKDSKLITPAMINNYVKLGIIPPPKKKRYTREHICYLFIICTLKSVMPIPSIMEIIKAHTATRSVYELYDMFCDIYEKMLLGAAESAKEILGDAADVKNGLAELALFMAINASTAQFIASGAAKPLSLPAEEEKK